MNNSKVFWSILTAAAAGAAIGMLFAPEDGVKTRKKIKKSANNWATETLEALETAKGKVQEAADRLVKGGVSLKDEALAAAKDSIDDVKNTINKKK